MTDYLEQLLAGADALMEQLRRLEGQAAGFGPWEEERTDRPVRNRQTGGGQRTDAGAADRRREEQAEAGAGAAEEGGEQSVPGTRRPPDPLDQTAPPDREAGTGWEDRTGRQEASPLLEELERLDRSQAALNRRGEGRLESAGPAGGRGGPGAYPVALSGTGSVRPEFLPEDAGWSWNSLPASAQDSAGGEMSLAEQTDQAFRRDSRRYDGGFFLY